MSSQGYSAASVPPGPANGTGIQARAVTIDRIRRRYWLHFLLLFLTLLTTTAMGARMAENFRYNRPAFDIEHDFNSEAFLLPLTDPGRLATGLPFALCLLVILLAHEMGHYLACLYYRVDATLPYFIPAPSVIGTFGAFIRIRSPIFSRQVLFDVGIAGPLAGFVFLLPVLSVGLAFSKIIPGIAQQGDLIFGTPPVLRLLELIILPGVPASDIYLHPVARAGWIGIFATALNLLPIGQLDGGHILYSFIGEKHRRLSRILAAALLPLGIFRWQGWLVWAGLLFLFGMRHPSIYDPQPLGQERVRLGWVALAVFALSFTWTPFLGQALVSGWP